MAALASHRYDASGHLSWFYDRSGRDDVAHGVVEGHFQDLDKEVNGVPGAVFLRPAPIGVFDEEARIGGQLEVAGVFWEELESLFLQEREQRGLSGCADLLASPARGARLRCRLGWHCFHSGFWVDGSGQWGVAVLAPVGLDEDAVDLFEIDDAGHRGYRRRFPNVGKQ